MPNSRTHTGLLASLVVLGVVVSRSHADQSPSPGLLGAGPLGAGELVKLFDQVPEKTKLAFYDGAAYLSTETGLFRHKRGVGLERIDLTHPRGEVRSVARVARARDGGGLYVAAGFETGGFLSPWDGALFSLADPMTPVQTFNRPDLEYVAVDDALRAYASSEDFQYVLPPDNSPVLTLPDAGLVLTAVTHSGLRLIDAELLAPDGSRVNSGVTGPIIHAQDRQDGAGINVVAAHQSGPSNNDGEFSTRRGEGEAEGLSLPRAARPSRTLDAGAWVTTGDIVLSWREVVFTQPPYEGLIQRGHRLHLPAEHFPFDEYQPSQGNLFQNGPVANSTGTLWSAPLEELYPELRQIDFERVTDFVTSEGQMHFSLTGSEGMWLFSAADPTFIPEPSGGVLAWLVLGALSSRTRLPRR
ncbi:hypothetical protein MalM25_07550 [Planctomycetes bacterium MalM25]|nr:hypothetical protein MalM25_07550 [Planctomycetes bacterium MalM25]